jgi:hypothetical protein
MPFQGSIIPSKDDGWKGQSPNPHQPDQPYENHESDQKWAEVRRLTEQGINLLLLNARNVQQLQGNQRLKTALAELSKERPSPIVRVDKGIHQRGTTPHITAQVVGLKDSLHIWLSAKDAKALNGGDTFAWEAVAVSAEQFGALVPQTVVVRPGRRDSITQERLKVLATNKQKIQSERAARRSALDKAAEKALESISSLFG